MDLDSVINQINEFNKFERRPGATAAVYSCDVLTCIATLKSGSTFLTNTFHNNLRWRKINFQEINWDSHVFSLLINPIDRQAKAIAEWIYQNNLLNYWSHDVKFKKIVLENPLLDIHSYSPMYLWYTQFANKIDWIPSDNLPNYNAVKNILSKLLNSYKIYVLDDKWSSDGASNIASAKKKKLEKEIKQLIMSDQNNVVLNFLKDDIDLYNRVCKNFNAEGKSWKEITWLKT